MSSPIARRGAWAPDPVIDAPTAKAQGPADHTRPAYAVTPWPTQHAQGVHVEPSRNALSDFTRQDAKALGIPDVTNVGAGGITDTAAPVTTGCMPLK